MGHDEGDHRRPKDVHNDKRRVDEKGYEALTGVGSGFDRRSFLKVAGAAAAGTAGMTGTAAGETTRHGVTFDSVLDAVDDLGLDSSGGQSIAGPLEDALRSGTLVEFPPGEYRLDRQVTVENRDRIGIRGTGDDRRDVTFVPPSGEQVRPFNGGSEGMGRAVLENVSFDQLDDEVSGFSVYLTTTGGLQVRNVGLIGRGPRDTGDFNMKFGVCVTTQDGVAVVEDFAAGLDQGAVEVPYGSGLICLWGGPSHRGEVVVRDPTIHNQNGSAMRYTGSPGVVTLEGGEFVNNQNASIRFGAGLHPSKRSSATGSYARLDEDLIATSELVRVDASGNGDSGALFQGLELEWLAGENSARGVISFPDFGGHGAATFRDCVVRNESPSLTVNAQAPAGNVEPDDAAVTIENCHFFGSGGGFSAVDRPGSVIRDSCIAVEGDSVRGFETENISSTCQLSGNGSGGKDTGTENTLVVRGTGTATQYRVSASSSLVGLDGSIESHDTVDGSTAEAWVTTPEHVDKFGYDGEITGFEILQGGPLEVTRNGESVAAGELGARNRQPSSTISASTDGLTAELSAADSTDPDGDLVGYTWDIAGTTETGETVSRTFDSPGTYTVSLSVEDDAGATATASTEVTVSYPNRLRVRGTGVPTRYTFEVDGKLSPVDDSIERWDDVSETGATGWVTTTEDVDKFDLEGELSALRFEQGEAEVYLDGTQIDPSTF